MAINKSADWSEFFSRLDAAALASTAQLVELLPGGHREGREYRCGNINGGPGQSFGFNLDTGVWVDFATGERGGVGFVSLYARVHGLKNGEAALEIARKTGMEAPDARKLKIVEKGGWRPVAPFADELKDEHWNGLQLPPFPGDWGKATDGWLYLDDTGRPWNYRIRFETADGKKDYRPLSWCEDERGAHSWRWRDLPPLRILWNLEKLAKWPERPVVVVEGEKTACAAERLLPDYVVVTWSGGAGNEQHSNWKPLTYRQTAIYLWPDYDEPGQAVMLRIAQMFATTADVRVVKPDPAWEEKTDLADLEEDGWTAERALLWLLENSGPAVIAITPDAKRPECDITTKDHGILQNRVWTSLKELNAKKQGPFYFFGQNGVNGDLKSVRPNALNDFTLTTLSVETLRAQVTKDVYFTTKPAETFIPAKPEAELLTSLLAAPSEELPPLNRFVRTPVFARDGRLIGIPGYDRLSGIYYAPASWVRGVKLIEKPTHKDMCTALDVIGDVLVDFKFESKADEANAFALLLLPLVREMIDGPTPLHRIEAAAYGAGKTLLLSILLSPTIDDPHWLPETKDEEEWRKMLVGALREGWSSIVIDNARTLDSSVLNSLLTAPQTWGARLLGQQDMPQYKVKCVFACTVNNPVWSVEIHRRMLPIRLKIDCEKPFERENWTHTDIRQYVKLKRRELLSAAITLAQYGIQHPMRFTRTKGSYETWARVVGPILAAVGFEDFLKRDEKTEHLGVSGDGLGDLIEAWLAQIDADANDLQKVNTRTNLTRVAGTAELYPLAIDLETFTWRTRSPIEQKKELGRRLHELRGQVRNGWCINPLPHKNGKAQFALSRPEDE